MMEEKGYTEKQARQMQAASGSLGGAATVKKGLAVLKEKNPKKYEAIRLKALKTRRANKNEKN